MCACTYNKYVKFGGRLIVTIAQKKASFTRLPRWSAEIKWLDLAENLRPFTIERTIILQRDHFINFLTDMTVERQFLKRNHHHCRIDDEEVWHCLLVTSQGYKEGILVMADEKGFPVCVALFWKNHHQSGHSPEDVPLVWLGKSVVTPVRITALHSHIDYCQGCRSRSYYPLGEICRPNLNAMLLDKKWPLSLIRLRVISNRVAFSSYWCWDSD